MLSLTHPIVDIAITPSRFEASLHFYHECLGLDIVMDLKVPEDVAKEAGLAPGSFRQVRLKAGNTLIKLMDIDSPPPKPEEGFRAGVRWLTFFVANIEETIELLERNGLKFLSDPVKAPDVAGVACVRDPDGILIEFVQL